MSRTYAIPVIAGSGLPAAAEPASKPMTLDANGQPLETMPAQESVRR
jgi:hypothetical protein